MEFFNLNDGQAAIVRILSSSVDKIERGGIHTIVNLDGTKKKVRCLGENCPLCDNNNTLSDRLFVHLWDYTDNQEKVWNRTPNEKFINSLKEVEADWGPINSAVLRITREGNDFPKYNVSTVNPTKYEDVSEDLVDKDVAWLCSTYRSADEMNEFIKSGTLPDHVKKSTNSEWLPKEEWLKRQPSNNLKELKEKEKQEEVKEVTSVVNEVLTEKQDSFDEDSSPFSDDFDDPFSGGAFQFDKI